MPGSRKKVINASDRPVANGRGPLHRGDIMSPETRSALMARIRGKNTGPERTLRAALKGCGVRWHRHAPDVPGKPDLVCRKLRVVVFVDGDFWHGWRFPAWRDKLTVKWAQKIISNRRRDARVRSALRRKGWRVLCIWEHQIERDLGGCVKRILSAIEVSRAGDSGNGRS
jgi:DNA mismatch endonuclease (patch repair protein)